MTYDKTYIEAVAVAMVAEEGHGHNDPPLYDDLDAQEREIYHSRAETLLVMLARLGYRLVRERIVDR